MKSFASDNYAGVHPVIMDALMAANQDHAIAYGDDLMTAQAQTLLKEHFGQDSQSFFVFNGTAANVLSLASATRPHQAILCTEMAHINVDECGAPERFTLCKLLPSVSADGKIDLDLIPQQLEQIGVQHHVQPRIISISQTSEVGTVYSIAELKAIADFAHSHQLYLHIDGARLSNAAASLNCSLADITSHVGADIVSFGGTKNGLMYGEAVVVLNPSLATDFQYMRKQAMQLASKMRFVAAQFIAYLQNDQWRTTALHANAKAKYLGQLLGDIKQIKITQAIQANAVFACFPKEIIAPLQAKYPFYVWVASTNEVRLMCSWDTKDQEIEEFVKEIKQSINTLCV